jgi:hypothetical protein
MTNHVGTFVKVELPSFHNLVLTLYHSNLSGVSRTSMGEVRSKDLPTAPPLRGYLFIVWSSPPQGANFSSKTGKQGSLTSIFTLLRSILETYQSL